jgi:hypothetical protein
LFFALSLIPLPVVPFVAAQRDSRSQGKDLLRAEAAQPV